MARTTVVDNSSLSFASHLFFSPQSWEVKHWKKFGTCPRQLFCIIKSSSQMVSTRFQFQQHPHSFLVTPGVATAATEDSSSPSAVSMISKSAQFVFDFIVTRPLSGPSSFCRRWINVDGGVEVLWSEAEMGKNRNRACKLVRSLLLGAGRETLRHQQQQRQRRRQQQPHDRRLLQLLQHLERTLTCSRTVELSACLRRCWTCEPQICPPADSNRWACIGGLETEQPRFYTVYIYILVRKQFSSLLTLF